MRFNVRTRSKMADISILWSGPSTKSDVDLNCQSGSDLKTHTSAQHFDGVSANANVGDTLAVSRGSHIHFARTTSFDALSNHHLFVTVCDPVLDHPTGGTTRR